MARKASVTSDEIVAAADRLHAEGRSVTVRAVYEALGSRGDFKLYSSTMAEWRESQEERQELAEVVVPEAISQRASELVASVWKEAVEAANVGRAAAQREVAELKEAHAKELAEAADFTAAVQEDLEKTRVMAEDADQRAEAERQSKEGMRQELHALQTEHARIAERADARAADAQAARDRADNAEKYLADAREDLLNAREAEAERKAELKAVREELREKAGRLDQVQADLGGARADLAKERAEHAATRNQLQERLERLSADLDTSMDAEKAAKDEALAAKKDAATSRQERDEAVAAQVGLAARVQELELLVQESGKE